MCVYIIIREIKHHIITFLLFNLFKLFQMIKFLKNLQIQQNTFSEIVKIVILINYLQHIAKFQILLIVEIDMLFFVFII